MTSYLCKGCGYKFRPRGAKKSVTTTMCPACGRTGSLVENEGLINKFLKEADTTDF
ncbi:hypothetical protein HYX18_03535 [Candidatus Woesearchaeota archaeon]|nr:hypothetical protein [Candidatus Woesearchaeota archaeon]